MTDEVTLQPDLEESEDQLDGENLQADSELAPETDNGEVEAKDESEGVDKDPAGFTKAINKQHHLYKEEQRRADALKAELEAVRKQLPQEQRPDIPALPDPYDDKYAEMSAARDEAVRNAVRWDTQQQMVAQQQASAQQAAQQAEMKALNETVMSYSGRAEKLGVKPQELQAAGNTVAAYGISDNLTQHILADEKGPLITTYLARHPNEMEKLSGMTPIQAGIYIANSITPKVSVASGITQAPNPPDSLGGGGAPPKEDGARGITYT